MPSIARWVLLCAGLMLGGLAHAQSGCAAVAADATGGVRFQVGTDAPQAVRAGRPVPIGALVITDDDASAALRFSDGQVVVLGESTRFRIVSCQFNPQQLDKSGVFLNLIEGSARLVMGAIGQHNPALIRIQVGTGTVAGMQSPDGARGGDAGVSVLGTVTLLAVTQGQVSLTLPSGQSMQVAAGQAAMVEANGAVRQGSAAQIASLANQSADGRSMVEQMVLMQSYAFAQRDQQTSIILATVTQTGNGAKPTAPMAPTAPTQPTVVPPASQPPVLDLPPIGVPIGTPPTGSGGGGTPCAASCN